MFLLPFDPVHRVEYVNKQSLFSLCVDLGPQYPFAIEGVEMDKRISRRR